MKKKGQILALDDENFSEDRTLFYIVTYKTINISVLRLLHDS